MYFSKNKCYWNSQFIKLWLRKSFQNWKKEKWIPIIPESSQKPAGDILDDPEICGEEEGDHDKTGDEGGGEEPTEHVQGQWHHLEHEVEN